MYTHATSTKLNESVLLDLVKQYQAPLFVYDGNHIIQQYQHLQQAFRVVKNFQINYACKALTNTHIIRLLHQQGAGLDTVSINEIRLGLQAGVSPKKIIFTPSGISEQELEQAIQLGVKMNIDNLSSLRYIASNHPNYPIGIRLNPNILAGGNLNISVGHESSKFGIPITQLSDIHALNLNIIGVHIHTGSDIKEVSVFMKVVDILLEASKQFPDLQYIDIGSGFKVKYKKLDKATPITLLGEAISQRFNAFCKQINKELTLICEPGKYLVSESGYFLARVNTVKTNPNKTFVCLDTGFNHLIRPTLYNAYHHITNISNTVSSNQHKYTIVGYICEKDTFAESRILNQVNKNDILCFHNAGAYCFSMASNYNARFRPAEVLLLDGQDYLIRRRETLEDLSSTLTDVNIPFVYV